MTASRVSATITHTVLSQDGATISYLTLESVMGDGAPALVIPGALSMAADYNAFASALAERFTVHIMERRGRGLSSPQGDDYSMRKECDDVLALQRATGASLLVGHSFGGLVALEVARNNQALSNSAVYAPGASIDGSIHMGWMPGYQKKLAERRDLDAFVEFSLAVGPDRARNTPPWLMKLLLPLFLRSQERNVILSLLSENLREHQEVARLDSSYERYRDIPAGVLLMYGGKSQSAWVDVSMERLAAILPRSQTQVFPKLDHFGIAKKAPQEVARRVTSYFLQEQANRALSS